MAPDGIAKRLLLLVKQRGVTRLDGSGLVGSQGQSQSWLMDKWAMARLCVPGSDFRQGLVWVEQEARGQPGAQSTV